MYHLKRSMKQMYWLYGNSTLVSVPLLTNSPMRSSSFTVAFTLSVRKAMLAVSPSVSLKSLVSACTVMVLKSNSRELSVALVKSTRPAPLIPCGLSSVFP